MSIINNNTLLDKNIPEAPPLVTDPTAQKVQKQVTVIIPEVVANAMRESERQNEQTRKQIQKLLIDRICEKPLFLLLTQETAPQATPQDAPLINKFVTEDLVRNFDAILSRIGHAKMDRILKNLCRLGTGVASDALSRKMGLEEIEKAWDNLPAGSEALLELITITEDTLARYPTLLLLLPDNLKLLIESVRQMKVTVSDTIDICMKEIYVRCNPIVAVKDIKGLTNEELRENACAAVVKRYPFMDLAFQKEARTHDILIKHLSGNIQCKEKREKWMQTLKTLETTLDDNIDEIIAKIVEKEFVSKYEWLKANIPQMQIVYYQGLDIHRNTGIGTCLQNCCEREALLLNNPQINTQDIPMASSAKGRRIRSAMNVAEAFPVPKGAPNLPPFDTFTEFGLARETIDLDKLSDLNKALDSYQGPVMLSFVSETSGHIINIQCDPTNKIFRFFDDNLGSFSYACKNDFVDQLTDFLTAFYPEFGDFKIWHTQLLP